MENSRQSQEFIVTARKWRPLQFKDVVGQEHITITLKNAIRLGRIHHACLFSGPRGVGKTTTARIFARALNCLNPHDAEPCNECEACTSVTNGRSMDVIEIDGASNNSVDDIRKLRENSKYPPAAGKYKMYIIDEVHMLSTSAFNALLKTLEEPPPHLIFVFATTEPHKVPATILSRCQRFEFRRMEIDDIVRQLSFIASKEDIKVEEEALISIAKKADGSMRDSQSIFDQVVAFCGRNITYSEMADALHLIDRDFFFRISSAVKNGDLNEMFSLTSQIVNKGYDLQECLNGLLEHFRNILAYKVTGNSKLLDSSASFLEKYKNESAQFSKPDLLRIMNIISSAEQTLKYSPQPRLRFEMALVEMASMDSSVDIKELLEEIKSLKKAPAGNGVSAASLPAQQAAKPPMMNMDKPADYYSPPPQPQTIYGAPSAGSHPGTAGRVRLEAAPAKSAPFTSQVLNAQMPSFQVGKEFIPVSEAPPPEPSRNDVSSDALRTGWRDFLSKYATGDSGFHMLSQSSIVMPKFYNGEIIFQAANQFAADNINKRKQSLIHNLSDFFGDRVSVKIAVGISVEEVATTGKEIANDNIPKAPVYASKPPAAAAVPAPMPDFRPEAGTAEAPMAVKHPVEIAIIELFGAKEYGNSDTM